MRTAGLVPKVAWFLRRHHAGMPGTPDDEPAGRTAYPDDAADESACELGVAFDPEDSPALSLEELAKAAVPVEQVLAGAENPA
jgi:hypothetical protein